MLQALLRGKLSREQENMEDVLTSNVFGLLQYVPLEDGLLPLLARAEAIGAEADDERFPLRSLAAPECAAGATVEYDFWPFWNEAGCISCEPDVVIRILDGSGRRFINLVEAKYRSGKSTEANETDERPNDQLAREWDNLVRVAQREQREPCLIYLTTSIGVPVSEIEASVAEYSAKRPDDPNRPAILALSWRQVPEVFQSADHTILKDLRVLFKRLGLMYFHGVHVTVPPQPWSWRFRPSAFRWTRLSEAPSINWRFTP